MLGRGDLVRQAWPSGGQGRRAVIQSTAAAAAWFVRGDGGIWALGEIVQMLVQPCGKAAQPEMMVSIVGAGGIWKTTLAQMVFNDARVGQHFDVRCWVSVSTSSNKMELAAEILRSAQPSWLLGWLSREDGGCSNAEVRALSVFLCREDGWISSVYVLQMLGAEFC